jgi:hypothetical protein
MLWLVRRWLRRATFAAVLFLAALHFAGPYACRARLPGVSAVKLFLPPLCRGLVWQRN